MKSPTRLDIPDADITLFYEAFTASESHDLFLELEQTIKWQIRSIRLYGRTIPMPRLTAWYGDPGKSYAYSCQTWIPEPWIEPLNCVKARVESLSMSSFNSVLVNLYRDERDSMAWHSDDEKTLGENPVIASVSFGEQRSFQLQHRTQPDLRSSIPLPNGSLLLMQGTTQQFWKHRLPKSSRPLGPRLNLTFRTIR